jgi:uncharacterized SAM-binding protein YcdF (DUF218 family)
VLETLKHIGGSGFLGFFWLCVFLGVLLLFVSPRTRRFAKHWLLWISGVYLVLGLPVVAHTIARALPAVVPQPGRSADVLIVLDGDNRRGRLQTTLEYLQTRKPKSFWVMGEEWLIEELQRAGYPRQTFGHETETSTTREQMAWVARFVGERPTQRVAVVASRLQMPRVEALARAARIDVQLVASPLDVEPATHGWRLFLPAYSGLRASRDALYEIVALAYYRRKGWI